MDMIAAGLSDVGLQREHNEDSFCIVPELDLFIVADGMGGHKAGNVASKMATHAIVSFFEATQNEDATWPFQFDPKRSVDENRLITGIKVANKKIFEASIRDREVQGMGTTVVSLLHSQDSGKLYVAHVGDSRCYRIQEGKIVQITRDHSLVNDYLLVMPEMSKQQQQELPKNVITRALGMQDSVVVDVIELSPEPGDVFLLCSDGLSGMVTDEDMLALAQEHRADPDELARRLVAAANEAGGEDNITVVLVLVSGNATTSSSATTSDGAATQQG